MQKQGWHCLFPGKALEILGTDSEHGLSAAVAEQRLQRFGPNQLEQRKGISPWQVLVNQFKDFMVVVLLAATAISGFMGEVADAFTIMAIVIFNAVLGFVQEYKAEKSMEALQRITAPEAVVLRDGLELTVPASSLVPGDIILLDTGNRVPADARLLQTASLEVEESMLTGESVPVRKQHDLLLAENANLGDRRNMVFMGTVVTRGRAKALVVATAMATEMGQIFGLLQQAAAEPTPLQRRLDHLGRWLVGLCLIICGIVVVTGVFRGEPPYQMFLAGVSLAVAAIPEGLPAIVTVSLAIGVQKMIRRRAIIRKLPAVETLGCATVICSDKTGTLTQNEMTVTRILVGDRLLEVSGKGFEPRGDFLEQDRLVLPREDKCLATLLTICALCNNARLKRSGMAVTGLFRSKKEDSWHLAGDPTEGALLVVAAKAGIWRDSVEKEVQRLAELPFDSERKRMSVIYGKPGQAAWLYTKGAPDVILSLCDRIYLNNRERPLTPELRQKVLQVNEQLAAGALRVLGMAYKSLPAGKTTGDAEQMERDLVFVGLAGMIDPPRPAAVRAVQHCRQAGIKTIMITGDHPLTARAIARELNLPAGPGQVMTGLELDHLSDAQLTERVEDVAVFARVSPKHKLRIVKALKSCGHVVAMTGDGINDAPAVKEADIGVAMGKTGTDVTKEASAMVLADDNFATIVAAVEEGRAIYDNIRKFIRYLLSCNIGEVLTMFLVTLLGYPIPLLPIQILWVNLVTDGFPAMALGVDKADPDIMQRRPRRPQESIFAYGLGWKILSRGVYIGAGTSLVFLSALFLGNGDLAVARTMAFCTLVFSQLFHVFDCKSEKYSVFQLGFLSNPYLVAAAACSVAMQLIVVYWPVFQSIFKTVPLNAFQWGMILLVAGGSTFCKGLAYYILMPVRRRLVYLRA
ncbi:MAG: calcium-translocating P-type ATPase, SERCA-type [Bacillota bacterium]